MKKKITRFLAFCMATAMLLGLTACGGGVSKDTLANSNAGEGKVFTEPTELDVMICSHVSWPYNENWAVWKYIEEATGANLNIAALPSADITTKMPLMMAAPETLPDLLHTYTKSTVDNYALSGPYVALNENEDKLPNMYKFLNSLPENEKSDLILMRTSSDGNMYFAPAYGTHTVGNVRSWMYRKDIFEKHGLEVPQTAEEMYQVAKKLKELYPDSYPICFRGGFLKMEEWGPSWAPDLNWNAYCDFEDNETWKLGPEQPQFKSMIEYFIKLRNEGLVPPDFLTIDTKSWEELMSTDRGFISLEYIVRIDFFNIPNREVNPDYTWAMMPPPKPDIEGGIQSMVKGNVEFSGYSICNNGRKDRIDSAFKFLDWFYSDEAYELLSWGKEGETYEVVDGKKRFILSAGEDAQNKYGFGTYGTYQNINPQGYEALYSDEQVAGCYEVMKYTRPKFKPTHWLAYDSKTTDEINNINTTLNSYLQEELSKFIIGEKPMSEWDAFVAGLKDFDTERLLELYTESYKKMTQSK